MLESVVMPRAKLIEIVTANLAKHIATYDEAMDEYHLRYRERLVELLSLTESRGPGCKYEDVKLRQPRSHAADYERAIGMLEHSVLDNIEINEHTYRQLVLDQWTWLHEFQETTALYGKVKHD